MKENQQASLTHFQPSASRLDISVSTFYLTLASEHNAKVLCDQVLDRLTVKVSPARFIIFVLPASRLVPVFLKSVRSRKHLDIFLNRLITNK